SLEVVATTKWARLRSHLWWDRCIRWLLTIVTCAFLITLWLHRYFHPDDAGIRNSISAYFYHDVMKPVFVGTLFLVGTLLILYRGQSIAEGWMLNVAGVLLMLVAVFPMDWQSSDSGMSWHAWIHYISAVLFFICLGSVNAFRSKDTL